MLLGNDIQAYKKDLTRAQMEAERLPFIIANIRGTIEALTGCNGGRRPRAGAEKSFLGAQ